MVLVSDRNTLHIFALKIQLANIGFELPSKKTNESNEELQNNTRGADISRLVCERSKVIAEGNHIFHELSAGSDQS